MSRNKSQAQGGSGESTVLFNVGRREMYHPNAGFKLFHRKLRAGHRVEMCVSGLHVLFHLLLSSTEKSNGAAVDQK